MDNREKQARFVHEALVVMGGIGAAVLCLQAMADPPPCDTGRPDCGSPDGISGSKKGGNRRTHASATATDDTGTDGNGCESACLFCHTQTDY